MSSDSITLTRQPDGRWVCVARWRGLPDSCSVAMPPERAIAAAARALHEQVWQHAHGRRVPDGLFPWSGYSSVSTLYTSLNSSCTMRGPSMGPRSLNRMNDSVPLPKYSTSSSRSDCSSGIKRAFTSAPVIVLGCMLWAFLKGGGWNRHSKKVPQGATAPTPQAPEAINSEARQPAQEGAHA